MSYLITMTCPTVNGHCFNKIIPKGLRQNPSLKYLVLKVFDDFLYNCFSIKLFL